MNSSGDAEIFSCFRQLTPLHSLKPGTLGGPALGMDLDIVNTSGESVVDDHEGGMSRLRVLRAVDDRVVAER
ncbi:hypothetical protein [Natrinema zhouii]|uniref:hypothetical protein n=1 Tax=Natrinema zhouii TaxID=1710539 RepID=UPI003CE46874